MSKHSRVSFSLILIFLFGLSAYAQDEKKTGIFRDTLDGKIDASAWLADYHGFLPILMPITEPAVDYGIAGGFLFLHRSKKYPKQPPGVSFVGGGYTFNNSWAVFGFHRNYFLNDRIRYTGAIGYVNINLNFYRTFLAKEFRANMNMDAPLIFQQVLFRIPKTRLFIGGNFLASQMTAKINESSVGDIFDEWERDFNNSSLKFRMSWDSRDNAFTPNRGIYSIFDYGFHEEWMGSDFVFKDLNFSTFMYGDWVKDFVFGLRAETNNVIGDVPFFAQPYLNMRGMPVMRYQGKNTLLLETEERWNFTSRLALVGFIGAGVAMDDWNEFSEAQWKWAGGGGLRYLMARWFGFYGGFDVAWGEEGGAFYVTIGSNWGR